MVLEREHNPCLMFMLMFQHHVALRNGNRNEYKYNDNLNLNQNFSSKLERKLHYVLAIECTQQASKKQPYLTMRAYIYMNTYTTLELINIPLGTWSAHDLIMLR